MHQQGTMYWLRVEPDGIRLQSEKDHRISSRCFLRVTASFLWHVYVGDGIPKIPNKSIFPNHST